MQQECIKLNKNDHKDIKINIPSKCCSFELCLYQKNPEKMYYGYLKNIKQNNIGFLFST